MGEVRISMVDLTWKKKCEKEIILCLDSKAANIGVI